MAKVKFYFHASNVDADADGDTRAMTLYLVQIHWKLSQASANVIFYVYGWFHLIFVEQLPLVEQYHAVSYSST